MMDVMPIKSTSWRNTCGWACRKYAEEWMQDHFTRIPCNIQVNSKVDYRLLHTKMLRTKGKCFIPSGSLLPT